ncbi:hypothetical protein ACSVIJ_05290 [Pseudomonas sp. NCHU5208]|uniref:hypothetical protein n=1 Tax=unclassified Pseudomonas TaxID=196821 RepID=UPI003F9C08DE
MTEKVFELNKAPLTTEQLEKVATASKRDACEWLFYLAIPLVPWITFSLLPIDDVVNKGLIAMFIAFVVLSPLTLRSLKRTEIRADLIEATEDDLVLLAERISETKEHRSPAVDGYLAAVRALGRELRFGEVIMLIGETGAYVEKAKHAATVSDARSVLYGKQEQS